MPKNDITDKEVSLLDIYQKIVRVETLQESLDEKMDSHRGDTNLMFSRIEKRVNTHERRLGRVEQYIAIGIFIVSVLAFFLNLTANKQANANTEEPKQVIEKLK